MVVVDGSVATIGAARWASAVARHTGQGLVAIVLHQAGPDGSGQVVLGRTEPTLRSSGTPLTVLSCRVPAATSPRRQARLLITSVRRCLASVDVALLVLPGDRRLADPRWRRHSLVAHLAAQGDHDLLIVPGLGDTPARRTAAVGG